MGFDITDAMHIDEVLERGGLTPEQIAEGEAMLAEWERIRSLPFEGDERSDEYYSALDPLNRRFWCWLSPPGTVFDADTGLPLKTKAALEAWFAEILARDIED